MNNQPTQPIERIPLPEVYEVPWFTEDDDFSGTYGSGNDDGYFNEGIPSPSDGFPVPETPPTPPTPDPDPEPPPDPDPDPDPPPPDPDPEPPPTPIEDTVVYNVDNPTAPPTGPCTGSIYVIESSYVWGFTPGQDPMTQLTPEQLACYEALFDIEVADAIFSLGGTGTRVSAKTWVESGLSGLFYSAYAKASCDPHNPVDDELVSFSGYVALQQAICVPTPT